MVPPQGRERVLEELHQAHPRMTRMKGPTRGYVLWPQMGSVIEMKVKMFTECLENQRASDKAPVHPWEIPNRPWSSVHVGPIEGKMITVLVDPSTKWIEAEIVNGCTCTSHITIERPRHVFTTQGLPDIVVLDNTTCFMGQTFPDFLTKYRIRHIAGASFRPSNNGLAKRLYIL